MLVAPSTTWLFVTIVPPDDQITPLPSPCPCGVSTRIETIEGDTCRTIWGIRSNVSPAGAGGSAAGGGLGPGGVIPKLPLALLEVGVGGTELCLPPQPAARMSTAASAA